MQISESRRTSFSMTKFASSSWAMGPETTGLSPSPSASSAVDGMCGMLPAICGTHPEYREQALGGAQRCTERQAV